MRRPLKLVASVETDGCDVRCKPATQGRHKLARCGTTVGSRRKMDVSRRTAARKRGEGGDKFQFMLKYWPWISERRAHNDGLKVWRDGSLWNRRSRQDSDVCGLTTNICVCLCAWVEASCSIVWTTIFLSDLFRSRAVVDSEGAKAAAEMARHGWLACHDLVGNPSLQIQFIFGYRQPHARFPLKRIRVHTRRHIDFDLRQLNRLLEYIQTPEGWDVQCNVMCCRRRKSLESGHVEKWSTLLERSGTRQRDQSAKWICLCPRNLLSKRHRCETEMTARDGNMKRDRQRCDVRCTRFDKRFRLCPATAQETNATPQSSRGLEKGLLLQSLSTLRVLKTDMSVDICCNRCVRIRALTVWIYHMLRCWSKAFNETARGDIGVEGWWR